jgi:hypothetical protein
MGMICNKSYLLLLDALRDPTKTQALAQLLALKKIDENSGRRN